MTQTAAPSPQLAKALSTLNSLISQGIEYPDAHFKACFKHLVNAQALQDLYDAQRSADTYEARVQQYENQGLCRSDAQAAAEADQLCARLA